MTHATQFLNSLAADIKQAIAQNDAANVDKTARALLDMNSRYLKRQLLGIETELSLPEHMRRMGEFGPNGRLPGIIEMIDSSKWHRDHGERECAPVQRKVA